MLCNALILAYATLMAARDPGHPTVLFLDYDTPCTCLMARMICPFSFVMREALGSLLDLAPLRSYKSGQGFDVRRGWWVRSIWFVLLARSENQPEEPDRPERPLRGFVGGLF